VILSMPATSPTLTEQRNANTRGLDVLPTEDLVALLTREQAAATGSVAAVGSALTAAVDAAAERLSRGGRLVYAGAGTSGRLGETDASELAPTFGFDRVATLRPGTGEGSDDSEDDLDAGRRRAAALGLGHDDVVLCVSASGRTPFVVGVLDVARAAGALTIAITSNPAAPHAALAEHAIELLVGPEPVAGSTRMKAGLAQKLALTTFSTALMIRLGRTFDNLMVEVPPQLAKLRARRVTIIAEACGLDRARAEELLSASGDDLKVAVVRQLTGAAERDARAALEGGGGIRAAIERLRVRSG
jgi:N-acetylmuramic acid 6-phosphate etherase